MDSGARRSCVALSVFKETYRVSRMTLEEPKWHLHHHMMTKHVGRIFSSLQIYSSQNTMYKNIVDVWGDASPSTVLLFINVLNSRCNSCMHHHCRLASARSFAHSARRIYPPSSFFEAAAWVPEVLRSNFFLERPSLSSFQSWTSIVNGYVPP